MVVEVIGCDCDHFSTLDFHSSGRFSSFHLDIPFLLIKSLVEFDTLDGGCSLPLST